MRRFILWFTICVLMCPISNICSDVDIKAQARCNQLTFDLNTQLKDDANELTDIPWFSPFSTAYNALGLCLDELMILRQDEQLVEISIPVYLKPFERNVYMVFRYLIDESVNGGEGALIEVYFNLFVSDGQAYRELIEIFTEMADRPELPYIIDSSDIDRAVEGRRSLSAVSGGKMYFDETLNRKCCQYMQVTAGSFSPTDNIGKTLGTPIGIKIALWVSIY